MANENWSQPTIGSNYSDVVGIINGKFEDLATGLVATTATNLPTNAIGWSSADLNWKKWNGSNWNTTLSPTNVYNITTTAANRWSTAQNLVITGDGTGTFTSVNGSAAVTATLTLATANNNVGTFGSATAVPVISVNAKGLVTGVTSAALGSIATQPSNNISITGGSISGLTNFTAPLGTADTATGRLRWNTATNALSIGTGSVAKTFVDTDTTQTLTNKTWNGVTVAIAYGGTGATTAAAARTNLDVDQAGTAIAMAIALG